MRSNAELAADVFQKTFMPGGVGSIQQKVFCMFNCSSQEGIYLGTGEDNRSHKCIIVKREMLDYLKGIPAGKLVILAIGIDAWFTNHTKLAEFLNTFQHLDMTLIIQYNTLVEHQTPAYASESPMMSHTVSILWSSLEDTIGNQALTTRRPLTF